LKDDELAERIEANWEQAGLDDRRATLLRYVSKLTLAPSFMRRGDVEGLRKVGFSDADILAVCEVVGYYAYVNRIADGLGVQLEEHLKKKPS
jgi:uncharacterized peroxidase-related enzyme